MILLTPDLRQQLRTNAVLREMHLARDLAAPDPIPAIKLFNPCGAATWLATELGRDDDTLFGLADLGFGCPELGSFSLSEIASVRLPFGLGIERDLHFVGRVPLSVWSNQARRSGSILLAEAALRSLARTPPGDELPTAPD
ncbi:DUF2958 domain-containing protein [Sphingobium sp. YC-XJ3]|jgi:hypothetical protein|uniref:DUF2958 domain-containing protein n=1 Tax=Sphingobium sp. YC-XJ3 TaxID=3024245 RepID=UPI00235F9FF1|nr:DUF2958 domain-containing protein [Sphingobium sp. YC-XJ3]WDA39333.1 DUF2958 domain-containing protein [Sphingobium sp. YC-XJ3]